MTARSTPLGADVDGPASRADLARGEAEFREILLGDPSEAGRVDAGDVLVASGSATARGSTAPPEAEAVGAGAEAVGAVSEAVGVDSEAVGAVSEAVGVDSEGSSGTQEPATEATAPEATAPDATSAPPGARRALRAARRRRRQIELVCVLVVAAFLAVTIAILGMARNQAPTPRGAPSPPGHPTAPAVPHGLR